jgi:hypothetical protein
MKNCQKSFLSKERFKKWKPGGGLAEVDLLDVERLGLRVSADLDDAADADVEAGRDDSLFCLKMRSHNST